MIASRTLPVQLSRTGIIFKIQEKRKAYWVPCNFRRGHTFKWQLITFINSGVFQQNLLRSTFLFPEYDCLLWLDNRADETIKNNEETR